jgi:hypothetical protein
MVQLSHLTCSVGSLEYGWTKELLPKFGLQLDRDVTFLPIGTCRDSLHGSELTQNGWTL